MWSNTSERNTRKLQLIQNFACRIILELKKIWSYFKVAQIILRITYYTFFSLYFLNLLYGHLYLNCNYGRIAMQMKS